MDLGDLELRLDILSQDKFQKHREKELHNSREGRKRMLNKNEMRKFVSNAYPGKRWQDRVKKMSDAQVYATYMRLNTKKKG